jgi:hypothetical protein
MNEVTVGVQSAWFSKINWTQAVAVLAMIATVFGFNLDSATQVAIVSAIVSVQAVVTWVIKTFFTTTVTPSSAKKV